MPTVNAQVSVSGSVDSGGVVTIEGQPQSVNVTTNTRRSSSPRLDATQAYEAVMSWLTGAAIS